MTPPIQFGRGRIVAGLLTLWLGGVVAATTPQEQGLAVVMEAERRGQGFGDSASTLQMTLRNKRGEETIRRLRSRILEQADDGDRSLIIFDDPRDIRGTAFLTFSHKQGPDDQWLYLPALKRVKRIASSNQSGPFVGSEFAYEDLGSQEIEKYDHRLVGEEMFDGRAHFVIERSPRDSKSGYTRHVIWVDQEEYRTFKVDYYDRKGSLLKTLKTGEYQQYLGRFWRPGRMEMVNHQTGKSTTLIWSEYTFRNGFTERDFSRSSLADTR